MCLMQNFVAKRLSKRIMFPATCAQFPAKFKIHRIIQNSLPGYVLQSFCYQVVRSALPHSFYMGGPKGKLKASAKLQVKFPSPQNFTIHISKGYQKWLPRVFWSLIDAPNVKFRCETFVETLDVFGHVRPISSKVQN